MDENDVIPQEQKSITIKCPCCSKELNMLGSVLLTSCPECGKQLIDPEVAKTIIIANADLQKTIYQEKAKTERTSIEEQSKTERAMIDKEKTLQMGDKEIEKAACQQDAETERETVRQDAETRRADITKNKETEKAKEETKRVEVEAKEKTKRSDAPFREKKWIILFCTIVVAAILFVIGSIVFAKTIANKIEGNVQIGFSSAEVVGKDYKKVEALFKENGFSNVMLVPRKTWKVDIFHRDGAVESVSIGTNLAIVKGGWYSPSSSVVITYWEK